jgi:hypothetical protein
MDGHNDSHLPSRVTPKDIFRITGSSYKALGMSERDVGDDVVLVIKGAVKAKSENQTEEGVMDFIIRVEHIEDNTPRSDRDENNRLKI